MDDNYKKIVALAVVNGTVATTSGVLVGRQLKKRGRSIWLAGPVAFLISALLAAPISFWQTRLMRQIAGGDQIDAVWAAADAREKTIS